MIINFNDFTNEEMKNIQKVYYVAEKELLLSKEMEVNLVIVSPETIKEMNNEYRQVDRVTDVLSFPMLDNIDDLNKECDAILGEVNIGDIYICRERAIEQEQVKESEQLWQSRFSMASRLAAALKRA